MEKLMVEALKRAIEAIKVEDYGLARKDIVMVLKVISQEMVEALEAMRKEGKE